MAADAQRARKVERYLTVIPYSILRNPLKDFNVRDLRKPRLPGSVTLAITCFRLFVGLDGEGADSANIQNDETNAHTQREGSTSQLNSVARRSAVSQEAKGSRRKRKSAKPCDLGTHSAAHTLAAAHKERKSSQAAVTCWLRKRPQQPTAEKNKGDRERQTALFLYTVAFYWHDNARNEHRCSWRR